MKTRFHWGLLVAAVLVFPGSLFACLWDYDTLKQERSRFPSTLELITGKFLRHSPEFYQWRIEDRLKKLKSDPKNLAWHDDLAVAYDKIGQPDKAIAMMEAKETIQPGLYETYANWGTFLIHKGEFARGLPYIDKAIAINPDAHFGREKYQKWLVEYVASKATNGKPSLPLCGKPNHHRAGGHFQIYLSTKLGVPLSKNQVELSRAIQGVLGIMRFSKHDSPIVLEALGDLLLGQNSDFDAKLLATRAYLKASYACTDPQEKTAYREMARWALDLQVVSPRNQTQLSLEALEKDFQRELNEAQEWYEELKSREIGWIQQGADPEKEFDLLYAKAPTIDDSPEESENSSWFGVPREFRILANLLLAVGGTAAGIGLWKLLNARKYPASDS